MADFTAVIECGFLEFEVEATIDAEDVCIRVVLWGGKPLLIDQEINFEEAYGVEELKDEIMTQYRRECEWLAADMAGEAWDAERGVA